MVISLRAHAVSLVAVFLALAIGVVVGGQTLHATVVHDLRTQAAAARTDAAAARSAAAADRETLSGAASLAGAAVPRLLPGRLPGRAVVLLSTPDAIPEQRARLAGALQAAGARLAADIRLAPPATVASDGGLLTDVATRLGAPPPGPGSPVDALAGVLAGAVAVPAMDPTRVLATLRAAGLVEPGAGPEAGAGAVVVLTGGAASGSRQAADAAAVVALARACAARGAVVTVTGPRSAATVGGGIAALRSDATVRDRVSSADGADSAAGPAVAALTLAAAVGGRIGHYGAGPGATAALPPA